MSIVTRIAKKFVLDRRDLSDPAARGFVSFIAMISVAGLALGVTALLVVTSVMNGFEREMKGVLTAFHGHILLFSRSEPIDNPTDYAERIKKEFPAVTAVSPYFFAEAMLSSPKAVAGTVIEGVHRPTLSQVSTIEKHLISGHLPEGGTETESEITLGSEVARKLRVGPGDTIALTIPFGGGEGADGQGNTPIVRRMKVVGVVKLGMYDYDSKYSLVTLDQMQKILKMPGKANAFKILTDQPAISYKTTDAMNEKYVFPIRARDWSTLNRNLFYAIRMEKVVISIILMAIVLVASFNVISTILMMVHEKKRQIAMLKALGLGPRKVTGIFTIIGATMSVLGAALGLGLGRALCGVLEWKSIIDLPPDVYGLSRLPIEIRAWEWALICGLVIVLALTAALWPAVRIGRQRPVEGLAHE